MRETLQTHIQGLISTIEADDKKLLGFFFMSIATRKQVLHCLKRWQEPLEDTPCYRTATVRRVVRQKIAEQESLMPPLPRAHETFDTFSFDELTVLLPGPDFTARRDPPLVELIRRCRALAPGSARSTATRAVGEYIDANWAVNPTLIDIDYEERNQADMDMYAIANGRTVPVDEMVPSMEWSPIDLKDRLMMVPMDLHKGVLPQTENAGSLGYIGNFFAAISDILVKMTGRVMVEAVVGEMADFMERTRWDCLPDRKESIDGIDPSKFPRVYDRIHMSNIPDYVGGLLTVATYGRPLLRDNRTSDLRFNVLLNPPQVRSGTSHATQPSTCSCVTGSASRIISRYRPRMALVKPLAFCLRRLLGTMPFGTGHHAHPSVVKTCSLAQNSRSGCTPTCSRSAFLTLEYFTARMVPFSRP